MLTAHLILNNELRSMGRASEAYDQLVEAAREAASRGVLQSSVETRRIAFQKLDRIACEGMTPIRSRRDGMVSRSGKTATFESCHVTVMPEVGLHFISRQFRLVSVRLLLAHDEILVEKLPLQAVFRFHAGEQMFHRSDVESGHFRKLATDLLDWSYAIKIADALLPDEDTQRFLVPGPAEDGLILGYLDETAAVPAGVVNRFTRNAEKIEAVAASPFAPGLFVANTYIGENEIRLDQKDLRGCWIEWRKHFEKSYQLGLERLVWPFRTVSPATRMDRVGPDAVEAVKAFILDPRAIRTMRNRHIRETGMYEGYEELQADDCDTLDAPMLKAG